MRTPWAQLGFVLHVISLLLLIAGFHWNAWIPVSPGSNSRQGSPAPRSPVLSYELHTGTIFEAIRILLTASLAVFVTAMCVLFMQLIKCIRWPGRAMVFFVLSTLFGVVLLVTCLVLSAVGVRRGPGAGSNGFTWGFYVEWAAVGHYILSAVCGILERRFPRTGAPDQTAIMTGNGDGIYRGDL